MISKDTESTVDILGTYAKISNLYNDRYAYKNLDKDLYLFHDSGEWMVRRSFKKIRSLSKILLFYIFASPNIRAQNSSVL